MNKTGQFRFTPPTHALLAFKRALEEYHGEGALEGRMTRCNNDDHDDNGDGAWKNTLLRGLDDQVR